MKTTRIIGIVLSIIGGLASIVFGRSAATVHQQLFLTTAAEEAATVRLYTATGIGVAILLFGIFLIVVGRRRDQ
ncbi:MAG: hypothetical protein KDI88_02470 [Gammaproteobacteria bacterium]|nr:hypothetical protein [Gammaproteobacteria bacterium]